MSYRDSQKLDKQLAEMPKPKLNEEKRMIIQNAIASHEIKKTPGFPFFKTMGAAVAVGIFTLLFITNLPNQTTPPNTENLAVYTVPQDVSFIEVVGEDRTTGTDDEKVVLSFYETIGKMEYKETTTESNRKDSASELSIKLYADSNRIELLNTLTFNGDGLVRIDEHYYEVDQNVVDQFTNYFFSIIDKIDSEDDPENDPTIDWVDVERDQKLLEDEQNQVDQGHQPGKLNPQDTAFTFIANELEMNGDLRVIQQKMSETHNESEVYFQIIVDGTKVHLLLDQPVKIGRTGIWSVYKYAIEHNEQQETDQETNNPTQEEDNSTEELTSIEDVAEETLKLLADQNMEELSNIVHSEKGLTFSPYVYIGDNVQNFSKNELKNLLSSSKSYLWGFHDASGEPIELSGKAYLDQFVNADYFLDADENDPSIQGAMVNNIKEKFPNATSIEYFKQGAEEYAWQRLYLLFEKEDGEWKLVGVVHSGHTI